MNKRVGKFLCKLFISSIFIAFIFYFCGKDSLIDKFKTIPISFIVLIAGLFAITQVMSATKWHVLVRNAKVDISLFHTIKIFFIGMFVNMVGVGTVGGDIVRALLIDKTGENKSKCLATVVADRAIGLSVLASIGLISAVVFSISTIDDRYIWLAILFILVVSLFFFYIDRVLTLAALLMPKYAKFFNNIAIAFPKNKFVLCKVILLAFIFHISQILLAAYIINFLGAEIPFSYILFAVPFINFLTTLPLSFMGLGLREGAYAYFFVPAYFSTVEQAILVGTVWSIANITASCIGGVIAFTTGELRSVSSK